MWIPAHHAAQETACFRSPLLINILSPRLTELALAWVGRGQEVSTHTHTHTHTWYLVAPETNHSCKTHNYVTDIEVKLQPYKSKLCIWANTVSRNTVSTFCFRFLSMDAIPFGWKIWHRIDILHISPLVFFINLICVVCWYLHFSVKQCVMVS